MLNATLSRALFGALILCAPALAIIPPDVSIRIGGATLFDPSHYAVHEGDLIMVAVTAEQSDMIWVFASPMNAAGQADYSIKLTLLFAKAQNGELFGTFKIPHGLSGHSFSLMAFAGTRPDDVGMATPVRVDVLKPPDPSTDPALGTPVLDASKQDIQKDLLE